ncbi:MAG: pirin family protein [Betaproteobacteria bacterium]|nr:pirin family protein [Betaproteobacteria bacterium]
MRSIERTLKSEIAPVGTFTVKRALPAPGRKSIGPWVFLDHFGPFRIKPGEDGVGPHPHAGIETVTYLLSGRNRHRDSAGHEGIVAKHGAQWMTAGRGIVHAEAPLAENEDEMTMHGIQLWTSLPRAKKLMERKYQRIDAAAIPEVQMAGATIRIVAGDLSGVSGPARTEMPLFLYHVRLAPGGATELKVADGQEAGAYVIAGEPEVNGHASMAGDLVVLDNAPGDLRLAAGAGAEVMVLGGAPAEGPLVFHGPFVMNSVEQVRQAERAYVSGLMGHLEA